MAKFATQFYATPDELAQFAKDVLGQHNVQATAVLHPFRAESVSGDDVTRLLMSPGVRTIVFTQAHPVLAARHEVELLNKNPGSLMLEIGRLTDRGLTESTLGTMATNPVWNKINALLKRRPAAGMSGIDETPGPPTLFHNFRFTAGARTLSEQGTALRQFAQSSLVLRPSDKTANRK